MKITYNVDRILLVLVITTCLVVVSMPSRTQSRGPMNQLAQINQRLAAIEESLDECTLQEFTNGDCDENPGSTSVTFCISQGRSGHLGFDYAVALGIALELGGSWKAGPNVDGHFQLDMPGTLGPFPLPTELAIGGSAELGRGLDICIEVPIEPDGDVQGILGKTDKDRFDDIVKGMNSSPRGLFQRTKFQRRLSRALRYADRRTLPPDEDRLLGVTTQADDEFDEEEFDRMDDAIERLMAGDFLQADNGLLGIFKDPIINDLRFSLATPQPLQNVLDDLNSIFDILPESGLAPGQICDTLGLIGPISERSKGVRSICSRLERAKSFDTINNAFGRVHNLPNRSQLGGTVKDIVCNNVTLSLLTDCWD